MDSAKTILLCGVGGQGTITAADLLAKAALEAGYEVKVSEIHGMAQRGGAVVTVVRFGDEVHTMVADLGQVNCIVAFEATEALRNLPYLKADGYLIASEAQIKPLPVACGRAAMPHDTCGRLRQAGALLMDSAGMAEEAGNSKCENVVLLGALESKVGFGEEVWERVIADRVPPKTIEANLSAFQAGLSFAKANS